MIGARLKKLRKEKKMTQDDVAKYLQIARATYSRYETEEREMTHESLVKLARLFDVSVDYILGRYDTNPILLNDEEIDLIEKFRALDERGRKSIIALAVHEYKQDRQ